VDGRRLKTKDSSAKRQIESYTWANMCRDHTVKGRPQLFLYFQAITHTHTHTQKLLCFLSSDWPTVFVQI